MVSVTVYLSLADFKKFVAGERCEGAFVTVSKDMAVEVQVPLSEVTMVERKLLIGTGLVAVLNDK